MKILSVAFLSLFYMSIFINNSYAYLDPGTGSMLLSAILGIVATTFFVLKNTYYNIKSFVLGLFGLKVKQKSRYSIVFYSEGGQYWHTFKPIIEELSRRNVKCAYLSSDEQDLGLKFSSELVESVYIGTGNSAFITLNMLEADIFVSTTPGLDVLQIKKSRGVKHYTYIFHACTDVALYKLFSFDCYDSIMVSGEHQSINLRKLESLRDTKKKDIYNVGVPYMDELQERIKNYKAPVIANEQTKTILIAPTWGNNGLLKMFGSNFIKSILETGHKVIIRPHPQSFISESEMIASIKDDLKSFENLEWDNSADNFHVLMNSHIMISDMSGVIFDYAFVFQKPVITMKFKANWGGTDGHFLGKNAWELGILNDMGQQISLKEIDNITDVISDLLANQNFKENIAKLRNKSLYNYGNVAKVAADTLMKLYDEHRSQ